MQVDPQLVIVSLRQQLAEKCERLAVAEAVIETLQMENTRLQGDAVGRDTGEGAAAEATKGQ